MTDSPARAIIWDLDGTLIDSAGDLAAALNAVLAGHGGSPRSVEAVRGMIGDGVAELLRRGFEAAGQPLTPAEAEALMPSFMTVYREAATRHTQTMPGVPRVLETMSRQGWRQAVCTNKPAAISAEILEHFRLDRWIDCVVGGDTTGRLKPDPLPIRACLERLGTAPDCTLVVGDSWNDHAAAQGAGVRSVIVKSGYGQATATDARSASAHTVDRIDRIPELAARLIEAGPAAD